jgi:hypothetical protein
VRWLVNQITAYGAFLMIDLCDDQYIHTLLEKSPLLILPYLSIYLCVCSAGEVLQAQITMSLATCDTLIT